MYVDPLVVILVALAFFFLLAFSFQYYLKPRAIQKIASENEELRGQIMDLNKQIGEIAMAPKMDTARQAERRQNVAMMKTRTLIVQFVRWERPFRESRILLSFVSAFLLTFGISYVIRKIQPMAGVDFWAIVAFMYILSYFVWGALIETYWKQKHMAALKKEFLELIRTSPNPLKVRDDLIDWMGKSIDVNDKLKRMIEGTIDGWLRQNLNKI